MAPVAPMLGNTNSRPSAKKHWSITIFDYTEEDILLILGSKDIEKYAFQEEQCPTTGKWHLQCYIAFKKKERYGKEGFTFLPFKGKCHFEGVRNADACSRYCQKNETRVGRQWKNFYIPDELKIIQVLHDWQQKIVDILNTEPDDRIIHWVYDTKGGKGKTALMKYILTKFNNATFSRCTKSADILTCADINKNIYLFDFARSQSDFAPYLALEQLKDGLISDCKLKKEQKNIIMNPPHVICFANWPPKKKNLSEDRWNIICLDENEEWEND